MQTITLKSQDKDSSGKKKKAVSTVFAQTICHNKMKIQGAR